MEWKQRWLVPKERLQLFMLNPLLCHTPQLPAPQRLFGNLARFDPAETQVTWDRLLIFILLFTLIALAARQVFLLLLAK